MKKIPVKIGWEIPLIILFVLSFLTYAMFEDKIMNIATLAPFLVLGFVAFILFSIQYKIGSEFFYIKNSIFSTTKIKIQEIYKIEKTWNPISSPAPSLSGRVEIYYPNKSIVISPKNFDEFKSELLKINPNIIVKQ